jgi:DNA repair exonuclease SbcCD nuclease subunit
VRIAILTDNHWGIRNDSNIFAENQIKFFEEVFFPYLKENGIKRILHLGDFYDNRKQVAVKTIHKARKHFLNKLRWEGIHMDIIPGNHDIVYKNTLTPNSLKELLGHYMNEITIYMEPEVVDYDGMKIALVPWVCSENYNAVMSFIERADAPWLAGHLELAGFEVLKGVPAHSGMDPKLFKRYEQVLSGHYHTASEKGNIKYLGSPMEFFWSDAHDPKGFHVLDTSTRTLERVLNPHTLFHRIRYDDTQTDYLDYDVTQCDHRFVKIVVVNKKDGFTFDRLIDKIQERPIHDLKIAENFSEFVGENVEDEGLQVEDTENLLDGYIDAVETSLDKTRIKTTARSLLQEAQSAEFL